MASTTSGGDAFGWVQRQMLNALSIQTDARPSARLPRHVGYIRIPTSIALTPRVLSEAMRKLPTEAIENVVDLLIQELDCRQPDPDFEAEVMECGEAGH
ncbi:hypothetical protein [Rhodopila sp.]|uniref:hypothetical protein n=1 Tax=Rhodopila sp. TaxID=2480087 RepID=UPI003D0A196C